MSAETTPKLETFLIVAYKRIRKPAGKVFRSIKRKHLTGIGDGRLPIAFPLYYYRPRLHHSGDLILKMRIPEVALPRLLPLTRKLSVSYDITAKEFVHIHSVFRYNQVLHEETFRSKHLFECFLGMLETESERLGSQGSDTYHHRQLLEKVKLSPPDTRPDFSDHPFTVQIKNGFIYYQDEQDCWITDGKGYEELHCPLLGCKTIADCIIGELGRYFLWKVEDVGSTSESDEQSNDILKHEGQSLDKYKFFELGWKKYFKMLAGCSSKLASPKHLSAGESRLDYRLVFEFFSLANQLFDLCIEPFHDLILKNNTEHKNWDTHQEEFEGSQDFESDEERDAESNSQNGSSLASEDEEERSRQ